MVEKYYYFNKYYTESQNFLELQDANFYLKKLAFAFLTDCVYWFLTSLKSCISRGLFNATGCFCAGRGQSGLKWKSEPRAISVLISTCFWKVHAFLRTTRHPRLTGFGQYPSRIPGPGRLERPARRSVLGSVWQWWGVVVWGSDPWDPDWKHTLTHYLFR